MNFVKYLIVLVVALVTTVFATEAPTNTKPALTIEHLKSAMKTCKRYKSKGVYIKCMGNQNIEDHVAEAAYVKSQFTENISDEILNEIINTKAPPNTEISTLGYILMGFSIALFLAVAGIIVHFTTKHISTDL